MFAIIEGQKTQHYDTFAGLLADPEVLEYFKWEKLAPTRSEAKVCKEQVGDAQRCYEEGLLSYDATLGTGTCVLYFPENATTFDEEDVVAEEICFHFRAYLAHLEDKRNGVY